MTRIGLLGALLILLAATADRPVPASEPEAGRTTVRSVAITIDDVPLGVSRWPRDEPDPRRELLDAYRKLMEAQEPRTVRRISERTSRISAVPRARSRSARGP